MLRPKSSASPFPRSVSRDTLALGALLRGPLAAYAAEREGGQGFGDWCHQQGLDDLRVRFAAAEATA